MVVLPCDARSWQWMSWCHATGRNSRAFDTDGTSTAVESEMSVTDLKRRQTKGPGMTLGEVHG